MPDTSQSVSTNIIMIHFNMMFYSGLNTTQHCHMKLQRSTIGTRHTACPDEPSGQLAKEAVPYPYHLTLRQSPCSHSSHVSSLLSLPSRLCKTQHALNMNVLAMHLQRLTTLPVPQHLTLSYHSLPSLTLPGDHR